MEQWRRAADPRGCRPRRGEYRADPRQPGISRSLVSLDGLACRHERASQESRADDLAQPPLALLEVGRTIWRGFCPEIWTGFCSARPGEQLSDLPLLDVDGDGVPDHVIYEGRAIPIEGGLITTASQGSATESAGSATTSTTVEKEAQRTVQQATLSSSRTSRIVQPRTDRDHRGGADWGNGACQRGRLHGSHEPGDRENQPSRRREASTAIGLDTKQPRPNSASRAEPTSRGRDKRPRRRWVTLPSGIHPSHHAPNRHHEEHDTRGASR